MEGLAVGAEMQAVLKSKIRAGVETASAAVGELAAGDSLTVLELGWTATGQLRVRHARGWSSTATAGSGKQLLRLVAGEGSWLEKAAAAGAKRAAPEERIKDSLERKDERKRARAASSASPPPPHGSAEEVIMRPGKIVVGGILEAVCRSRVRARDANSRRGGRGAARAPCPRDCIGFQPASY
jgi:hypothetical protein